MPIGEWLRPPRQWLVLFVGIALVLSTALAVLGVRLLQQDRALANERVRERLESAATAVAAALDAHLRETEAELVRVARGPDDMLFGRVSEWARRLPAGAVLLVMTDDGVRASPSGRLAFHPALPRSPDVSPAAFAAAEALEFRSRDLTAAADSYRTLGRYADSGVRAGAYLRLGRTLRKAGLLTAALDAYDSLATFGSLLVDGLPSALVARHARVSLLDTLGRTDDARLESDSLASAIAQGHWSLTRGAFEFYSREATSRAAPRAAPDSAAARAAFESVVLAEAAEHEWQRWRSGRTAGSDGAGTHVIVAGDSPVVATWTAAGAARLVLLESPDHARAAWLEKLQPVLEREGVHMALVDAGGRLLFSQISAADAPSVDRSAADARLPFTLRVASADVGRLSAAFAARRRLMIAGFTLAAALALFGTYTVARAVNRELEVARLQSDFVAAVSHEFRTPLTSMRQLTELLASGRVADQERRDRYYDVLKHEGERLHRLVEGLLDFGRMEAGAQEFHMEPVNAAQLVAATVDEFRVEAAPRGYEVAFDATDAPSPVRADREAIARAVWNLLENATRYSPDHRVVWVSVAADNGRVAVSVRDRGTGIPSAEQERIFEKFVRGSSAAVANAKGTGIGLAMVRHIVTAHGGEIRVESAPGEGSTFTILLDREPHS